MLSDEIFSQIHNRPSLADYQVVKGLLEQAIDDLVRLQLRPRISDTDVEQVLEALAIILLGRDVSYAVVLGWNCDGGIDAALAREFQLQDSDPLHIVGTYLGNTVNAALMLLSQGENRSLSLDAWLPSSGYNPRSVARSDRLHSRRSVRYFREKWSDQRPDRRELAPYLAVENAVFSGKYQQNPPL